MSTQTQYNRRTFLQATAAGAAALAVPEVGQALAASSRAPVTIAFWNPATDVIGHKATAGMVDRFNSTLGKSLGIFARDDVVPGDNYYIKYSTAMTSTGGPDVVMTYDYSTIASWAANGFVRPVDAYARAVGADRSDYFPIARDLVDLNGRYWGLTQSFCFNLFWWNRDLHHGPPPRTIAELDALSARYTRFDKHGNLIQAGIVPWSQPGYMDWNTVWGGSFYDRAKGKWTINTPQNRKVLEWFLKYVHMLGGRSKADALGVVKASMMNLDPLFESGRTAFTVMGESGPPLFRLQAPRLRYGITQMPTAPDVPYGTFTSVGGNAYLLPMKAPHPREAAIFLKYIGLPEPVLGWNVATGGFPPYKSDVYSPTFLKKLPWMEPYITSLKLNHMMPSIPSPHFPLFDSEMSNATDEVTFKRKTPAEALAVVERKVLAAVQQFKQFHPNWHTE